MPESPSTSGCAHSRFCVASQASYSTLYSFVLPTNGRPRHWSVGTVGISLSVVRSQPRRRSRIAMPSTKSDGTAPSSSASFSFHSSNTFRAVRRSPEKARASILARIASSLSSSRANIRSASCSIWRVAPVRRHRSISTSSASLIVGSKRACCLSFHSENSRGSRNLEPIQESCDFERAAGLFPKEVPARSRSRSSAKCPGGSVTCSRVVSSALHSQAGTQNRKGGCQGVPSLCH